MKKTVVLALTVFLLALPVVALAQSKKPSLREEAKKKDSVLFTSVGDNLFLTTFDQLVRGSAIIIRGRVVAEKTRLASDETLVVTDYTIEVLEVFKDPQNLAKLGERLVVSKPGGNIILEGTPVRMDTPGSPPIPWITPHIFFIIRARQPREFYFEDGEIAAFPILKGKMACGNSTMRSHPITKPFCDMNETEIIQILKEKIASEAKI